MKNIEKLNDQWIYLVFMFLKKTVLVLFYIVFKIQCFVNISLMKIFFNKFNKNYSITWMLTKIYNISKTLIFSLEKPSFKAMNYFEILWFTIE